MCGVVFGTAEPRPTTSGLTEQLHQFCEHCILLLLEGSATLYKLNYSSQVVHKLVLVGRIAKLKMANSFFVSDIFFATVVVIAVLSEL